MEKFAPNKFELFAGHREETFEKTGEVYADSDEEINLKMTKLLNQTLDNLDHLCRVKTHNLTIEK